MECSEDVVKEICFYVRHHDDFISWVLPDEKYDRKNLYLKSIINRNIDKQIQKVQIQEKQLISVDKWNSLLDLCRADVTAQADEVWQCGILMDSKEHMETVEYFCEYYCANLEKDNLEQKLISMIESDL